MFVHKKSRLFLPFNNNNNIVVVVTPDIFYWYIQTIDNDHGQEKEHLIDQGCHTHDTCQRRTTSSPTSQSNLFPTRSDTDIFIRGSSSDHNETTNNNSLSQSKRARSMLSPTKCSPS
jgi:hypothetical protein